MLNSVTHIYHKTADRKCTDRHQATNINMAMVSNAEAVSNKCNTSERNKGFFTNELNITTIALKTTMKP
jgi:hypothetical protein